MVTGGDTPVRIGLAGAGAIAQLSHLPAYNRIPGARVTAVCDEDRAKALRVAQRFGVHAVTDSFEELAGMDEVDAVDICLPNHLHAPATLAALGAGKDVLCERPFSRSSTEAARMVEAAARTGKVLMCGFNHRFREDANVLRRFVAMGELGRVFHVNAGWMKRASSTASQDWQKVKRFAGGGVLVDLGISMLDLGLWFLDMPRVVAVSAAAHPRPVDDQLETTAAALLRFQDGGTMSLDVTWGPLADRDASYLDLHGERGVAMLNPLRLEKEMHGSRVDVTPKVSPAQSAYRQSYENEIRHFVECIKTRRKPFSSGEDAVITLKVLEALYASAAEGREVRLA